MPCSFRHGKCPRAEQQGTPKGVAGSDAPTCASPWPTPGRSWHCQLARQRSAASKSLTWSWKRPGMCPGQTPQQCCRGTAWTSCPRAKAVEHKGRDFGIIVASKVEVLSHLGRLASTKRSTRGHVAVGRSGEAHARDVKVDGTVAKVHQAVREAVTEVFLDNMSQTRAGASKRRSKSTTALCLR